MKPRRMAHTSATAEGGLLRRLLAAGGVVAAMAAGAPAQAAPTEGGSAGAAVACPTDLAPRAPDAVLLVVQGGERPAMSYSVAQLAALPPTSLTQRLSVSTGSGSGTERSLRHEGVLLRDLLLNSGMGGPSDRGARAATIELVATDGYRAVFSWGELFNTAVGEQVIVITGRDGHPLDATAGPVALRSLADLRPGPRHVRNLCAVLIRR